MEGECHVPPQVLSKETVHLGYGKVVCDDKRLGSYVSPTLWKVESADDLIGWWEYTSPNLTTQQDVKRVVTEDEGDSRHADDDDDDDDYNEGKPDSYYEDDDVDDDDDYYEQDGGRDEL